MLNVVDCVIFSSYFVVKGLSIAILDIVLQSGEHTTLGLCLPAFRNHLEEHVDVHALVDV